jgi:hypothetical protein
MRAEFDHIRAQARGSCCWTAGTQVLHEMLGVRPMRFKAVRIAARSSAALGGISLNAHNQATVLRSTSTKNRSGSVRAAVPCRQDARNWSVWHPGHRRQRFGALMKRARCCDASLDVGHGQDAFGKSSFSKPTHCRLAHFLTRSLAKALWRATPPSIRELVAAARTSPRIGKRATALVPFHQQRTLVSARPSAVARGRSDRLPRAIRAE